MMFYKACIILCLLILPTIHTMDSEQRTIISSINNSISSGNLVEFKNLSTYFCHCSMKQLTRFQESITETKTILSSIIKSNYDMWPTIIILNQTRTIFFNTKNRTPRQLARNSQENYSDLEEVLKSFTDINPCSLHFAVEFIRSAHNYATLRVSYYNNPASTEYYAKQYINEEL